MSDQEQHDESYRFHQEGGGIVFDKPKSQEEIARETRDREQHEFARDQVNTNRRLAWFTGLLVVGTFIGTAISIWQASIAQTSANAALRAAQNAEDALTETRIGREHAARDAQHTREDNAAEADAANQRNMAAMEASDRQSKAALDASIDNSRLDQRPWVVISALHLSKEPIAGNDIIVMVTVINTGKTPAIDVVPQAQLLISTFTPAMSNFHLPEDVTSRMILAPSGTPDLESKSTFFTEPPLLIESKFVAPYYSHTAAIYVHVLMRYRDTYGVPHWTRVCVMHATGQGLDEFRYCSTGNDLDHNQNINDPIGPPGSDDRPVAPPPR